MKAKPRDWIVHGVIWRSAPIPQEAPPHRRVAHGDLAVLASVERAMAPADLSVRHHKRRTQAERLWQEAEVADTMRHACLLTAYGAKGGVVPFYFGGTVGCCQSLSALLSDNSEAFEAMLRRVDGCSEYVIRSRERMKKTACNTPDVQPPSQGDLGIAKNTNSKLQESQTPVVLSTLQSLIGAEAPFVRDIQHLSCDGANGGLSLHTAMLVPHALEAQFATIADTYRQQLARLGHDLDVTGPWPPYSFTFPNTIKPRRHQSASGQG